MAKSYPELGKILKKLLFEKDMKPADLSREVDIPAPTIHRLVTGKSTRPYKSSLKPIADYFDIEIDQLIGEKAIDKKDLPLPKQVTVKLLPMLRWDKAANFKAELENADGSIPVFGNIGPDSFALTKYDSSMEPLFPNNTHLMFDPDKEPTDRSYVLVKLHGVDQPIFRQLIIDADHKFLKPLNSQDYQMRLLDEKDQIIATLFESRMNHSTDSANVLIGGDHHDH